MVGSLFPNMWSHRELPYRAMTNNLANTLHGSSTLMPGHSDTSDEVVCTNVVERLDA